MHGHRNSKFIKIHSVETEVFYTDRWTDMKKLIVYFRRYANDPKNGKRILSSR